MVRGNDQQISREAVEQLRTRSMFNVQRSMFLEVKTLIRLSQSTQRITDIVNSEM
jgi:hypothetical protein